MNNLLIMEILLKNLRLVIFKLFNKWEEGNLAMYMLHFRRKVGMLLPLKKCPSSNFDRMILKSKLKGKLSFKLAYTIKMS